MTNHSVHGNTRNRVCKADRISVAEIQPSIALRGGKVTSSVSNSPNELNSTTISNFVTADQALVELEPTTGSIILSPEQLVQELAFPAASTSEVNEEEIDFDGELTEFKAQLPPMDTIPPGTPGEQDEQLCDNAKRAIMHYYGTSIIYEYLQGKYLFLLQQERAKPGTGTFVADLAELRKAGALSLSTATAYRRISNYEAVSEGLVDLLPRHLSQAEKDAWGGVEDVTLQEIEEALERNAGDEFTTKYQAMIAEQKKRLAKLKREQGRFDHHEHATLRAVKGAKGPIPRCVRFAGAGKGERQGRGQQMSG